MLIKLFFSFLKVGMLSFGGGLAALPLIQEQIVDINGWMSIGEFTDLVTVAQMTPGPIAINAATFVGTKLYGLPGAIVATLGSITPAIIIVGTLSFMYYRFKNLDIMKKVLSALRPAVVALIMSAGIIILKHVLIVSNEINYIGGILFAVSIVMLRFIKITPIKTMLLSGVLGLILYSM